MAGVHFSFDNFKQLVELNIGIADRLDENRAERFTILYCDFSSIAPEVVNSSLQTVLRTSDAVVNKGNDYYCVLPYTDQYGAVSVREIFEEFFDKSVASTTVSYPADGENVKELFESLKENGKTRLKKDLQLI
ncbi:hypothetical protein [Sulfurimonas marina]|uniref:GGDEF domain-containing protein n=1 Tax=Sulfurimonas marina TaxID=2590551 RepID=A0A7M3V903_9BACT|nr:hypothetical protein [Sulfurimonas marina]QOP40236.1 hypothetical protein FJR03_00155 [Sulfurimonas marina]